MVTFTNEIWTTRKLQRNLDGSQGKRPRLVKIKRFGITNRTRVTERTKEKTNKAFNTETKKKSCGTKELGNYVMVYSRVDLTTIA